MKKICYLKSVSFVVGMLLPFQALTVPPLSTHVDTPEGFYQRVRACKRPGECLRRLDTKHMIRSVLNTEVKNQGHIGTCVSFAVGTCAEAQHKRKLSAAEFIVLAETQMIDGDCKAGMYLGKALLFAQHYGLVDDQRLTYSRYLQYVDARNSYVEDKDAYSLCTPKNYNKTMDDIGADLSLSGTSKDKTDYNIGKLYELRSVGYRPSNVIQNVKAQLMKDRPVATALGIYGLTDRRGQVYSTNWDKTVDHKIRMPSSDETNIGSHAIVLAGFDDEKKCFLVRNSWGSGWGDKGEAWIPYTYIERYATELIAVGQKK